MIEQVKKYLVQLQESICSDLELLDGRAIFEKDHWTKEDGHISFKQKRTAKKENYIIII